MSNRDEELRQYLLSMVKFCMSTNVPETFQFVCMEDFVLTNGRIWRPAFLPDDVEPGEINHCYENAYHLAAERDEYVYVEGYACGVIPVLHAWCVDISVGEVVDPTWTTCTERGFGDAYFGVPFRRDFLRAMVAQKRTHGVIDNWENGFPLLTGSYAVQDSVLEI